MKKILFIITKSENGGAQKWTKEQIEICSDSFECFLATDKNGWLPKNVNVKNKLLDKLIYKRFSFTYLFKLHKYTKENNINLIVSSSANAGIYARLVKLLNPKVQVIYVSHGWSSIYNGGKLAFLYTFIEKQLSKMSDSVLCISKRDYENAKDIIKIKEDKLKWITNKINPMQTEIRQVSKKVKILTVARLAPPKRVDLIVKSVKNLNVELHVIGDGILRSNLENIAGNNVFFHGEVDGFKDFSSYDIFILISDSEGLPLSALEGMSVGMPLILSDVGGCFELIDNNGLLVNNTVSEIKNAINECMDKKEIFSENSKQIFDTKFNLSFNKNMYIKYYGDILRRNK